jgi:hypothetical protein
MVSWGITTALGSEGVRKAYRNLCASEQTAFRNTRATGASFGIGTLLLAVAPKTQLWLVERKKKGKARALTEFEKAEIAEKSKGQATDGAKPNEQCSGCCCIFAHGSYLRQCHWPPT